MKHQIHRSLLSVVLSTTVLLAACAPAATPAPEAMLKNETSTPEAMMMEKVTATPETIIQQEMPTAEAMMEKGSPTPEAMMGKESPTPEAMMALPDQLVTPHFVDSSPRHGDVFAQTPDKVLINFNFNLHTISSITVLKDDQPLEVGKTTLAPDMLSMSVTLPGDAGDGLYVVKYQACWPDRSCHEGQFAFKVASNIRGTYLDMTGKSEVTIRLKDLQFAPARIVVSQGTKVTWVNDDPIVHFVNSDPHPNHNALPALNSAALQQGDSYSFTFNQPGEWAYHCSAHVPQNMLGRILVSP